MLHTVTLFGFSENHMGNGTCNLIFPLCYEAHSPVGKPHIFKKPYIICLQGKCDHGHMSPVRDFICDITCCMFDIYTPTKYILAPNFIDTNCVSQQWCQESTDT